MHKTEAILTHRVLERVPMLTVRNLQKSESAFHGDSNLFVSRFNTIIIIFVKPMRFVITNFVQTRQELSRQSKKPALPYSFNSKLLPEVKILSLRTASKFLIERR